MTKDYEELFQNRIDELLVLEQRADSRAEKFIKLTNAYQEKSQQALSDLLGKIGYIGESLAKINAASEQIQECVAHSKAHESRAITLFLGVVIACVLFIVGTVWWSHHVVNGLAQDKADWDALDIKLKHKPVIVHVQGKDYVRVVPGSETGFVRGDNSKVPGQYAEMWHIR